MGVEQSESVEYGVARKGSQKVIGETFETVAQAEQHLAWVEGQIRSLGDEPDVRLVYVEVKTTRSNPKVYSPPKEETVEEPVEAEAPEPAVPEPTA
jgi:hypothetical protein